jgi:hypothetical protein
MRALARSSGSSGHRLTPQEGELKIERQGNLAAMLKAAYAQ